MEHIQEIEKDIKWLREIIQKRIGSYEQVPIEEIKPEVLNGKLSLYASFVEENKLGFEERLLLIIALIPHLIPDFLELHLNNQTFPLHFKKPAFSECLIGKVKGDTFKGILPTGLTYLYLLCGDNLYKRTKIIKDIFEDEFYIVRKGIVRPYAVNPAEPIMSNILAIDSQYALAFITNNSKFLEPKSVEHAKR